MRIKNVLEQLKSISTDIDSLIKDTSILGDIDAQVEYQDSPEDRFLHNEFVKIFEQLQTVGLNINYLNLPIVAEGVLRLNQFDRYVLISENGEEIREYSSGSGIEVLMYDNNYDKSYWVKSRIESELGRYYLYGYKKIESLEGLRARVRGV